MSGTASEGSAARPSASVRARARSMYPTSVGFQGAFVKGWYARMGGASRDANPYRGRVRKAKGKGGGVTFTVAWRNAWQLGWSARDRRQARS